MIVSEYQNAKFFFAKSYTQNWSEKAFVVSELKTQTYVIGNLTWWNFLMKKNC